MPELLMRGVASAWWREGDESLSDGRYATYICFPPTLSVVFRHGVPQLRLIVLFTFCACVSGVSQACLQLSS
jgi:hypothetical protein